MKTQTRDIFGRVCTVKCITGCNHDGFLEDDYCVPFFKLKYLIPALHHIFYLLKPSNIYRERDFVSSVLGNKLGEYTFLWFEKRNFYF